MTQASTSAAPKGRLALLPAFLGALLLIVALLFTSLELVVRDADWLLRRYETYGLSERIGIPSEDCAAAFTQLVDYMAGDAESIDITVTENGVPVSMYNDRERMHMVDVRVLYQAWRSVRNLGVPAAAVLLLAACMLSQKGERLRTLARGYVWAAAVFGAIVAALGIWVALDFNSFWLNFHYLFFDNDLWLLSYATDRMIRICPQELFFDIVVRFALFFLAAAGALLASAAIYLSQKRKQAHAV